MKIVQLLPNVANKENKLSTIPSKMLFISVSVISPLFIAENNKINLEFDLIEGNNVAMGARVVLTVVGYHVTVLISEDKQIIFQRNEIQVLITNF
jgi:hypothetical protein